jgi:hypothetical protein
MSKNKLWCIQEDDTGKIIAIAENEEEIKQAILRMKVSKVLQEMNVTENDFYGRLNEVRISVKCKWVYNKEQSGE